MHPSVLRDGAYLLPNRPGFRQTLQAQADDVSAGGGTAHVLVLDSKSQEQQNSFEDLFHRSADYAKLVEAIRQAAGELAAQDHAGMQRQSNRLRKEFEAIAAVDYFLRAHRNRLWPR